MRTVHLLETMQYPVDTPEPTPEHHAIAVEIMQRLQDMDAQTVDDEELQGLKLLRKLYLISLRSTGAYRLMLDMVSNKQVLGESIRELASKHLRKGGNETSKQNWFQKAHREIEIVKQVWPEIGNEMERLINRRIAKDDE